MATYIHLPEVSGIYQIVNNTTEKRYVGYASNIRQRLKGHVSDLSLKKHANNYLQKAWDKHGQNDVTGEIYESAKKAIEISGIPKSTFFHKLQGSRVNNTNYKYL
jgi:group I intron endonuclease